MSELHDWHRAEFTKRMPVTVLVKGYQPHFGAEVPDQDLDLVLGTVRSVVVARTVHGLSPDDWKHAQDAFEASDEGKALADADPGVRREHCELWLLKRLYEAEHPDLVPASESATFALVDHHAHPKKVAAHRARLVAHVKTGAPLSPAKLVGGAS